MTTSNLVKKTMILATNLQQCFISLQDVVDEISIQSQAAIEKEKSRKNKHWTEEEDAILREMTALGKSASFIAKRLKRTYSSVSVRKSGLGIATGKRPAKLRNRYEVAAMTKANGAIPSESPSISSSLIKSMEKLSAMMGGNNGNPR